ncbi:MAG: hypothetical protein J3K34DRAFT_391553 [Monoraphidium minutum]|nr:MAG: hypothetical protein J3K34DRAFT_391553 [Monoraphidium minutum]
MPTPVAARATAAPVVEFARRGGGARRSKDASSDGSDDDAAACLPLLSAPGRAPAEPRAAAARGAPEPSPLAWAALRAAAACSGSTLPLAAARPAHAPGGVRSKRVMASHASTRLMLLSASYRSRRELEQAEGRLLPPWTVHPLDVRMWWWNAVVLALVLLTLLFEPFFLAFAEYPGIYPADSPDSLLTLFLTCAYSLDIALHFLVAYYDEEGHLVTDLGSTARHYARWRLWVDLACTIPFDWIALSAMGLQYSNNARARSVSLLRLLRLGRAYRLKQWASFLANNPSFSLAWVTVLRNSLVLFYITHIAACLLYFTARQNESLGRPSWLLATAEWHAGIREGSATALERYCASLYLATVTFATVGYGDIHAFSVAEAGLIISYIYLNVYVGAYIIGTITLLVTRADGETGRYRSELAALDSYCTTHQIPQELQVAMQGHLRLHHSAREGSDDQVLAALPSSLRRRVLRHLYLGLLTDSWLLEGCRLKFLDALLGAAKVEHYMPKVEVVSEGDPVNELMVLVAGACLVETPAPPLARPAGAPGDLILDLGTGESAYGGGARTLGPGDPIAEMAPLRLQYHRPSWQVVRTVGVVALLSVPRTAWTALAAAFPLSVDALLGNLTRAAQELAEWEFPSGAAARAALDGGGASGLDALALQFASPELIEGGAAPSARRGAPPPARGDGGGGAGASGGAAALGPRQQRAVSNLLRVRALVAAQHQRLLRERTSEFLGAAAQGAAARVREMLQQGFAPDTTDYDLRTALMCASARGNVGVVQLLLAAGADPDRADQHQGCALLEAAKGGHTPVMDALLAAGAKINLPAVAAAAHLCAAVFDGDVPLLRRLLRAGLPADAGDWDGRTPAHVAAAEGSLAALKALIQEGGADPRAADRWGHTPLDEARRAGAAHAVAYLEERSAPHAGAAAAAGGLPGPQAGAAAAGGGGAPC